MTNKPMTAKEARRAAKGECTIHLDRFAATLRVYADQAEQIQAMREALGRASAVVEATRDIPLLCSSTLDEALEKYDGETND